MTFFELMWMVNILITEQKKIRRVCALGAEELRVEVEYKQDFFYRGKLRIFRNNYIANNNKLCF